MSIIKKVSEIEVLFAALDAEINNFQSVTKLKCIAGCGKCCTHNEVDASPLEFLPWAYQLYLNGEANRVLELISDDKSKVCHIYSPMDTLEVGKGSCSNYTYRGLICRLFGYGANTDKYGQLRLATCRIIKENQTLLYHNAQSMITDGLTIPIFTNYYMKLSQIDFHLGNKIVPINVALKMALEVVLQYYLYRDLDDDILGAA